MPHLGGLVYIPGHYSHQVSQTSDILKKSAHDVPQNFHVVPEVDHVADFQLYFVLRLSCLASGYGHLSDGEVDSEPLECKARSLFNPRGLYCVVFR